MNLCLNAFVIQFPDDLLDTCLVTAPRALLLPLAHRGHCKDEDSYKEYWSHVEFSISLTSSSSATAQGSASGSSLRHTSYAGYTKKQRRLSRWLQRLVRSRFAQTARRVVYRNPRAA